MLEEKIIEYCAPTLAGLKTANMFAYRFSSIDTFLVELRDVRHRIKEKGVDIEVLKCSQFRVLVYVYRRKRLEADLKKTGVWNFLEQYGYHTDDLYSCLEQLKERLQEYDCFPHEIGIFLGYPLLDVIGFIEQGGKNCKCCGIWKVYSNECEARKLFSRFKKCTEVYLRVSARGRTLVQLTVAA